MTLPGDGIKKEIARFWKYKAAFISLIVLVLMCLAVIIIPMLLANGPNESTGLYAAAPSAEHILGTDDLGRDNLARFLYGGRISFFVGLLSTVVSLVLGAVLGLLAGYYGGWLEMVILRASDVFMSFPYVVLVLVLVAAIGPSIWSVILIIGFLGWPQFARLLYAKVLSVKEEQYIEAARAVGVKDLPIVMKYIIPNSYVPLLVAVTFRISQSMLMESSLSFLGMGVQPPEASWGNILFNAQSISILSERPWMWLPAGIALVVTTLCFNFLGDGLRSAFDPSLRIQQ